MQPVTATDPLAHSGDVVQGNLAQLKTLFPEAFTEGKVDFDVLKQLLGGAVEEREEKYGLNWHGKRRARQLALTPSTGTLRPAPEDSVDWDTTQNLMIEGDNLEVLKLLQKSYAGKVKLIYIDPPYNTGKDFVYPDDFRDNIKNYQRLTGQVDGEGKATGSNREANGRFHTDWLNMMYPRIRLARDLLSQDGVFFASIDDSESANLKCILDECFGEENFIDTLAVEMSTTSGPKTVNAQQGTIVKNVEFVYVYRKSAAFDERPHTPLLDGIDFYDTHYSAWLNDDRTLGSLSDALLADEKIRADIIKYGLGDRDGFSIKSINKLLTLSDNAKTFIEANLEKIARIDRAPVSAQGRATEIGIWQSFEADHRTYFLTTLANGNLQALMPLSLNYRMSDDYKARFGRTVIRGDLWKGFHQDMGNVAKEGDVVFANGKKPIRLIKQLIKWSNSEKDGIILDFFAGSGTTAHAVMQLNADDGGKRSFITVQLPEILDPNDKEQKAAVDFCDEINKPRNIAELTKERIRRAAKGIKSENKAWDGDKGFRVLKLDSSNLHAWDATSATLEKDLVDSAEHIKTDRVETDVLYELLLKLGLDLCVSMQQRVVEGKTVHAIGGGVLMACLDTRIDAAEAEALAMGIVQWQRELKTEGEVTCVFRDSAFGGTDAQGRPAADVAKTNLSKILEQHGIANVRSI
ncbi:MAG: site-specific DNA-methyltransferase [Stagnimonas sp.]|nr:site-specific DNA-methyltransferase [Stagnimonas sp.]